MSSFLRWWINQFSIISSRPYPAFSGDKNTITISEDGFSVVTQNSLENQFSIDEIVNQLNHKRPVHIDMSKDRFFERSITSAKLPDFHIKQIAKTDSAINTPFNDQNSYFFFGKTAGSASSYYIVKKQILDPLINVLKSKSIKLSSISLQSDKGLIPLSKEDLINLPISLKTSFPIFKTLTLVLAASLVGTVMHYTMRYQAADEQLDTQIADYTNQVSQIRAIIQQQQVVRERFNTALSMKQSSITAFSIWDEFSKILPDSAWLTTLEIKSNEANATGYAKAASGLIPVVQASPLFKAPSFTSPVVAVRGKPIERFSISAKFEDKKLEAK